jgi:hypothetical protein
MARGKVDRQKLWDDANAKHCAVDEKSTVPPEEEVKYRVKEVSKFPCFQEGGTMPLCHLLEIEDYDDVDGLKFEAIKALVRKVEVMMNKRPGTLLRNKKIFLKISAWLIVFCPSAKQIAEQEKRKALRKKAQKKRKMQQEGMDKIEEQRAKATSKERYKRTSLALDTIGAIERRNQIHLAKHKGMGAAARMQQRDLQFPALGEAYSASTEREFEKGGVTRHNVSAKCADNLQKRANKRGANSSGLPRLPDFPDFDQKVAKPQKGILASLFGSRKEQRRMSNILYNADLPTGDDAKDPISNRGSSLWQTLQRKTAN